MTINTTLDIIEKHRKIKWVSLQSYSYHNCHLPWVTEYVSELMLTHIPFMHLFNWE